MRDDVAEAWAEYAQTPESEEERNGTQRAGFEAGYLAAEGRYAEALALLLVDVENGAPKWTQIYAARTALTGSPEPAFDEYAYQAWRKAIANG